ncbi:MULTISPECIES: lytic transglycosylase domain-containing protein [unclassified Sphingomonas]|uniref:lytic transglycosylase domain-containing protein n=1 Tax=unclassified Sphingomonas TaxID=196159 RepID=UPI0006F2A366|nr:MULTISPECIES: lytic transglycosylase domain-containing protein [unclassified Sphingomonas]KQX19174.1 lytic transglycosylase [Sphingomonas sp. Root1294]KQY65375.1 lytic transglycosylase [Sphingomonas sp. Root50]KRB95330.1 lytic transglycosylase [Sphingomonas sp. Root720]
MGALRLAIAAVSLAASAPASADQVARWRPLIAEASARFGVPLVWIEQVMRAESAGMTVVDGRPIRSSAGAIGLMQLMPGTWDAMRRRIALGSNPDDPRDNILAGTFYLRLMHDRFGYPGLFAAYNAGPTRYAAVLARKRALPAETAAYLVKLSGSTNAVANGNSAPPLLFIVRRDGTRETRMRPALAPLAGLFVVRSDDR